MPRAHHTPAGTGTLGMWLFLATLTMLFAASMIGYGIVRFKAHRTPAHEVLEVPWQLFTVSTLVILLSSFTLHQALSAVRREKQARLRRMLIATLALAGGFVIVQAPAMALLIGDHFDYRRANPGEPSAMFGLLFFLVLVHALHVIGGVIPLAVITARASKRAYDHEHYGPVRYITMYWHFLDGVWIFMFLTFLLTS